MATKVMDKQDEIQLAAIEWRMRINSGYITPEERAQFEHWREQDRRHADAYDQAITMWEALGTLDQSDLEPSVFKRSWLFEARRFFRDAPAYFVKTHRGFAAGMAAAMAVTFGISIIAINEPWSTSASVIETPAIITAYSSERAETKEITLEDGSKITLGAASMIEVAMSDSARNVRLAKGAAVFNVVSDPDRAFIVAAEDFSAKVVGTVFDVRNNGGVVRLSVVEGEVEVGHPLMIDGRASSMMTRKAVSAGERIIASKEDGLSRVTEFREEDFASWREDRLRYVGATLQELVADANRYSEREIIIDDALSAGLSQRATFTFEGQNVARMLDTLPVVFPVEIDDEGTGNILVRPRTSEN